MANNLEIRAHSPKGHETLKRAYDSFVKDYNIEHTGMLAISSLMDNFVDIFPKGQYDVISKIELCGNPEGRLLKWFPEKIMIQLDENHYTIHLKNPIFQENKE